MNTTEYLKRIRYSHELEPNFEVLRKLQKSHLLNIPFENLDIHYGIPIELDTDRIFNKIVFNNRGGFCYELNGLFYELLISLGFNAKIISARVYDKDKGYGPEFDHLAILVNLNGIEYLTDVGFGEFTFGPLKLNSTKIQNDQRGDFIIDKYDEFYFRVNKFSNEELSPEYIFKDCKREFLEFNKMCNYHQSNENSHFTQKRLISIPTEQGRITISGNTLKITTQKSTKEMILKNEACFKHELWNYFKIRIEH